VRMVAVTKSVGIDEIRMLVELGVTDLGENKVQELTKRATAIREMFKNRTINATGAPLWHMIGQLQRNKVKALLPHVAMIQSVDKLRLAEEIQKRAEAVSMPIDVLLEVNGGNEPQKSGVAVCAAPHLGEQIASLPHVRLRGLMTMAPADADESAQRYVFSRVRELFDETRHRYDVGDAFDTLSMGMSRDFETAILCGATTVRIGSALFRGCCATSQA
jgi:PLP dependent protein